MMLLRMLTDGWYDADAGLYLTPRSEPQYYVATDSMRSERYRGLLVEDLMDIAAVGGLHYQAWSEAGVLFHFTGALSEFGKLGITAVGKSPAEANYWFEQTRQVLDRETKSRRCSSKS
jgi:hypothetical protein